MLWCLVCVPLCMWAAKDRASKVSDADRRKAEYVFLEAENQKQQGNTAAFPIF